tara:strand:+ start:13325 stop:14011 length:687 start_codon:yes stop_codon:yes gene_type:complete
MMAERAMTGARLNWYPRHASELTEGERQRAFDARPCLDDRERAIRLGYLDDVESAAPNDPWFTLRVAFGREKAVERDLAARDIEAFVPMRKGPARMVRGRKRPALMIPAVTGYVMVRTVVTDKICAGLTAVENVVQLVGAEGAPHPVSHKEITRFRLMADEGKLDWEALSAVTYGAGEKVRITDGPFGSFLGVVVTPNTKGRGDVVVEADVFGRKTPVTLPLALIEKL